MERKVWHVLNNILDKTLLNSLYRYAVSLTGERNDAYDLTQHAVERYLRQTTQVHSPLPYMMRSIRNAYFDQSKQRKLHLVVTENMKAETESHATIHGSELSPSELLIHQQDVERLMKLLTGQERELLYLWAVEEYTVQEIAHIKSIPRGTLLSQLHRLKKRVREQLKAVDEANVTLRGEHEIG